MARKHDAVNKAAQERDLCAKVVRSTLGKYADILPDLHLMGQYVQYRDWSWSKEISGVVSKKQFESVKAAAIKAYLDACSRAAQTLDHSFFDRMSLAAECIKEQRAGRDPSGRPEVARTAHIIRREWAKHKKCPGFLRVLYALDAEFPLGSKKDRNAVTLRRSLKSLGMKLPSGH